MLKMPLRNSQSLINKKYTKKDKNIEIRVHK